MIRVICTYFV